MVARVHDLPRDGRPHDRGARRAQARPGVRDRVDGRPQARRVRPHAGIPRPRRLRQDRSGEVTVADEKDKKAKPAGEDKPKPRARAKPAEKKPAKKAAAPKK